MHWSICGGASVPIAATCNSILLFYSLSRSCPSVCDPVQTMSVRQRWQQQQQQQPLQPQNHPQQPMFPPESSVPSPQQQHQGAPLSSSSNNNYNTTSPNSNSSNSQSILLSSLGNRIKHPYSTPRPKTALSPQNGGSIHTNHISTHRASPRGSPIALLSLLSSSSSNAKSTTTSTMAVSFKRVPAGPFVFLVACCCFAGWMLASIMLQHHSLISNNNNGSGSSNSYLHLLSDTMVALDTAGVTPLSPRHQQLPTLPPVSQPQQLQKQIPPLPTTQQRATSNIRRVGSSLLVTHPIPEESAAAMISSVLEKTAMHSRIAFLDGPWESHAVVRNSASISPRFESYNNNDSMEAWQSPHQEQCLPMADWQTSFHPNCNSLHEIHIASSILGFPDHPKSSKNNKTYSNENNLSILGEGWFRTTWRLDGRLVASSNSSTAAAAAIQLESVVLKTLRLEREFLSEYYELHRRDAVAMERLTVSPFVVNIYGYCGQSAINELANFPMKGVLSLEAFNRRMRGKESTQTNAIKLRMAASIAVGLADIHAGGSSASVTADTNKAFLTHYDLNPRNIALFAGGRPKINDFNIAEFMRYDPTNKNATCAFPSRLHEPWWRAPEEMNTTNAVWVDEMVDIYALGNILYHTLTTHSARGKQTKDRMAEVRPVVAAGILPVFPDYYRKSKDPNVIAMVKAIYLCWSKDPTQRATAKQIADLLYEAVVQNSARIASTSKSDNISVPEESGPNSNEDDDKGVDNTDVNEDKDAIGHASVAVK